MGTGEDGMYFKTSQPDFPLETAETQIQGERSSMGKTKNNNVDSAEELQGKDQENVRRGGTCRPMTNLWSGPP